MGFGKALKKAVKHVVGGTEAFLKNPTSKEGLEAGAGMAIAGLSGGTIGGSLAGASLAADAGRRVENKEQKKVAEEMQQADLVAENTRQYGWGSLSELAEARRKKQQQLEERGEGQATGLASLIGKGKTLG